MQLIYRVAIPADIHACIDLRGETRENSFSVEQLRAVGVTFESWSGGVADGSLTGHVCLADGDMVGYSFGDRLTGEVVVLALLPEWEGKGIGKHLLSLVVRNLMQRGFQRLFLGCSSNPQHRSHGFYRHLGWKSTGVFDDAQDEVLEYLLGADTDPKRADVVT